MKSEPKEFPKASGAEPLKSKQLLRAVGHNAPVGEKVFGVSIFGFLARGQESEPRVLKAQLALAATTARNTRVTSPLWAAACAILCSVGVFGNVGFASTLFLPLAVTAAVGASALMATAYQHYNDSEGDEDSWLQCFVMIQAFGSVAWGLMPWLCWEPGNALNHMFLAACTMAVIAGLVVARGKQHENVHRQSPAAVADDLGALPDGRFHSRCRHGRFGALCRLPDVVHRTSAGAAHGRGCPPAL
jgi:hypothetical protein